MTLFITLSFFVIALSLCWNYTRNTASYRFQLIPNCLLTRYPIVFISSKSSIFYFGSYWNFIPQLLREHGYDVIEIRAISVHNLQNELLKMKKKSPHYHIIGDRSSTQYLTTLSLSADFKKYDFWVLNNPRESTSHSFPPLKTFTIAEPKGRAPFLGIFFIYLHNFIRKAHLTPYIVGLLRPQDFNGLCIQYLDFANSLAQSDFKCSNS